MDTKQAVIERAKALGRKIYVRRGNIWFLQKLNKVKS